MIKTRIHSIILTALLAASIVGGASAASAWETVKTEIRDAKPIVKDTDVEILTAPACIIVNAGKPVDIKVFTILGRVVSSETLPAGSSRLNVGAHGVYIVKVGELTCKVAI